MLLDFINDNEMSGLKKIDIRVSKIIQRTLSCRDIIVILAFPPPFWILFLPLKFPYILKWELTDKTLWEFSICNHSQNA